MYIIIILLVIYLAPEKNYQYFNLGIFILGTADNCF